MADNGVTRRVLADQVKDRLLEGIFDGTYPPESRIIETSVARSLGTSQAPVREALRALEASGLVEILPFRGAHVRRLDLRELLEAYVVRSAVEALGARLAVPAMSDADVEALIELGEQMQQAAAENDGRRLAEIDATFHGRIIELSGNKALARVWRSLEPFSRTYITLVSPGSDPHWTADLHTPILGALRDRDAEAVATALEHHFEEVQSVLGSRLVSGVPSGGGDARQRPGGDAADAAVG
jgi:DNA-binding GntR family transcriptional regulator